MKVDEYPRPRNDTGMGFCYFSDSEHTGQTDLDRWLPRLKALGASWLILQTPPTRPVPDSFLQQLMMADIEPLVMIRGERIGPMDVPTLAEVTRSLADSGVRYVVLFDRPNLRSQWTPQEWGKPALVERFVDYLAPALETAVAEGLVPVLPPLEPFGAYWDTTFLESMLDSLRRRGLADLLSGAAVGMRNFANDRPLDWGKGGQQAWPQSRPYSAASNAPNHRGFRLFDWYQPIVEKILGHQMPMIACANGPQCSQCDDGHPLEQRRHAERAVEMVQLLQDGRLPAAVFNHAFWVLSAERNQLGYGERWFDPDGTPRLRAVSALERVATRTGRLQPAPDQESAKTSAASAPGPSRLREWSTRSPLPDASGKPIRHYLLLPVFEWGVEPWYLEIVQEYVARYQPTCGFSVEEAKLANKVTVVGNEQGISSDAAKRLQAAGCCVERVAGRDGSETRSLFQQLALEQRSAAA